MGFLAALHTDTGTRKKVNQDAALLMQARSGQGDILMAAVCDGMGGLAKGELASSTVVRAFADWFRERLPGMLLRGFSAEELWTEWNGLLGNTNRAILEYAKEKHISSGTTAVAVLVIGRVFFFLNVGDSRLYQISDDIQLLTRDQTYVQKEMDSGRMTYEQSLSDPNRGMLLQCIGATTGVYPVYGAGVLEPGQELMLCSDGFRHVVLPHEFLEVFSPARMTTREIMEQNLREVTALNRSRNENDDISAVLIKCL